MPARCFFFLTASSKNPWNCETGAFLLRTRNRFENKFIYTTNARCVVTNAFRQNPFLINLGIFSSSRLKFPPKSSLIDPHLPNVSSAMLTILFSTSSDQRAFFPYRLSQGFLLGFWPEGVGFRWGYRNYTEHLNRVNAPASFSQSRLFFSFRSITAF